jgi:HemY protein
VLGGFLVYQVQQGSGYVLLVWGDTSIEMSLWFGLAMLVISLVVLWVAYTLIRGGYRGARFAKQKIGGYGAEKTQQQTITGLIEFIEGNWSSAHKKLTRAAKKVPAPIINYLAAARCAYELGNEQEALQLLHSAEKSAPNGGLAVSLTQARMQLSNQQYEQALATLNRAAKINSNHNVVLTLQKQVYVALKDWGALQKLLPKLHQQTIGSVKERYYLEQLLYRELLKETVSKTNTLPKAKKLEALKQRWKNIPQHFQQDEGVLVNYVNELIALNGHGRGDFSKRLKYPVARSMGGIIRLGTQQQHRKSLKNSGKMAKITIY